MRGSGLQDRKLVRVGDTVRRPSGSFTESVHHLLRHLRDHGFDLAPEPRGIDEAGREILSFILGRDQGWPLLPDILRIEGAERLGELASRLRSALASYECPATARWQFAMGAPRPGEAIQHGDLGLWNLLWGDDGQIAGVWTGISPSPETPCMTPGIWRGLPFRSWMTTGRGHAGFPRRRIGLCGWRRLPRALASHAPKCLKLLWPLRPNTSVALFRAASVAARGPCSTGMASTRTQPRTDDGPWPSSGSSCPDGISAVTVQNWRAGVDHWWADVLRLPVAAVRGRRWSSIAVSVRCGFTYDCDGRVIYLAP